MLASSRARPTRWATARTSLVALLAAVMLPALAQDISDVPLAVKNNVAPNLMFMVDNSGSMVNIVPEAPYDASITYSTAGCTGSNILNTSAQIDLGLLLGSPRILRSGSTFRHWTLGTTGTDRRCFNPTAIYTAQLNRDGVGIFLGGTYTGNYLNWYFGDYGNPTSLWVGRKRLATGTVSTRLEVAKEAAKGAIDGLPLTIPGTTLPAVRVGLSSYAGSDGGTLNRAIADFTPLSRTSVKLAIDALVASGNTPLAETMADIGRYMATGYSGNISTPYTASVAINTFFRQDGRNSCLTNGPGGSRTVCTDTSTRPIQLWCQRSYVFMLTDGQPQQDQAFTSNTYLRDYDRDCSGVLASSCVSGSPNYDRKIGQTYTSNGSDYLDDVVQALFDIDLRPDLTKPTPDPGDAPAKNNIVTYAIGFADDAAIGDPLLVDTAAAGGGGPLLVADDGDTLLKAFNEALTSAFEKDGAAAAVAVTSAQLTTDTVGYASSFISQEWSGDLEAYSVSTDTGLALTGGLSWSARDLLDARDWSTRKIASFNGSTGLPFTPANFAGTPASLTAGVIDFIRGSDAGEGTTYRDRAHKLGDIVNAEPVVVNYGSAPIIYQGANDGMLHVFDGSLTGGQELWAYVPRLVHGSLAELSESPYQHRYYVDSTPATALIGSERILVGGLGKGGSGYYALNITDPNAADAAAAAAKVKWEISPTGMGYTFGTPLIVRTTAGWRVVVPSGYNNGSGGGVVGQVWVINPDTGAVITTLSTGVGTAADPAGLAHLSKMANTAEDALVRYVYGGDLHGNVWRFDLDTASAAPVVRIAALTDGVGARQPVTAPVTVGPVAGSSTKLWVYVGTGRYLGDADVPGPDQRQSMYGIVDDTSNLTPSLPNIRGTAGATCPTGGGSADFVCQTLTLDTTTNIFTASTNPVPTATRRGFYVDIPITSSRVTGMPALTTGGTLVFVANVPSTEACSPGGSSYFVQISAATGGAIPRTAGGTDYYDAGGFLASALSSRVVVVRAADGKRGLFRLSDKRTISRELGETSSSVEWRRIYWRSLN